MGAVRPKPGKVAQTKKGTAQLAVPCIKIVADCNYLSKFSWKLSLQALIIASTLWYLSSL